MKTLNRDLKNYLQKKKKINLQLPAIHRAVFNNIKVSCCHHKLLLCRSTAEHISYKFVLVALIATKKKTVFGEKLCPAFCFIHHIEMNVYRVKIVLFHCDILTHQKD